MSAVKRTALVHSDETMADIWEDYDPDAVAAVLDETVGAWQDVDADSLIAALYDARLRGARPANRS